MSLQKYLGQLSETGRLIQIDKPVSKSYQASALLKHFEPNPVILTRINESTFPVSGNLFCTKQDFGAYFQRKPEELIPFFSQAIANHSPCHVADSAPWQEMLIDPVDLDQLPILHHFEGDGGNYITAGVVIVKHPTYGQNLDFHRGMQISRDELAIRVVRSRHLDLYLNEMEELDVAICIGVPPNVLAAAATSVDLGMDELEIANAMTLVQLVKSAQSGLFIPTEAEFVLEGRVFLNRRHPEGPFVDLTETQDIIRQEPIIKITRISHRKNAIWQALLPGGLEHKLLMGMPREPTIYQKVNQVAACLDVAIDPGGCSWLHALVKIEKQDEADGPNAIQAAFQGHRSLKHVFVVDKDIDIYSPQEVEWALATRFQADRDLYIYPRAPGSSLDPSADAETYATTRVGFDLTKPVQSNGKSFDKVRYPAVDIDRFLKDDP